MAFACLPRALSRALGLVCTQLLTSVSIFIACVLLVPTYAQNNRPPMLNLSLALMGRDVLVMSEGTAVNSLLAILEIVDPDEGPAGDVSCKTDNHFVGLGKMAKNFYKIALVNHLDREWIDNVTVDILCSDNGSPPLSKKESFSIVVTDTNDNTPTFGKKTYDFSLRENEKTPTTVGFVRAVDLDQAENGHVDYSVEDEFGELSTQFQIDEKEGAIVAIEPIDREAVDEIVLYVYATDRGMPPLIGGAVVKVQITDLNDNTPSILPTNMSVLEESPAMTIVGKAVATDDDAGVNAEVRFNLVVDGGSTPPFIVDSMGNILATLPLDRELQDEYVLTVSAADSGIPSLTSTSTMTITVVDINDHTPMILSPKDDDILDSDDSSNENITVDWVSPDDNKLVFQVSATDKDIGNNGRIVYSIGSINYKPVDDDSLFRIDGETGAVYLKRHVKRYDEAVQVLIFNVSDSGTPPRSAMASLNVTLDVDFPSLPIVTPTRPPVADGINNAANELTTDRFIFFTFSCFISCLFIVRIPHFNPIFT